MIFYAAAKFLAYSGWCYLGLRVVRPELAGATLSLQLGAARWLIGLAVGLAVFFAVGSVDAEAAARVYFQVYTPVRAIEWSAVALLIALRVRSPWLPAAMLRLLPWCAGGMLVSFVTDLLHRRGYRAGSVVGVSLKNDVGAKDANAARQKPISLTRYELFERRP